MVPQLPSAQEKVISLWVERWLDRKPPVAFGNVERQGRDNLLRNLVLNGENIRQLAVETFSPDMAAIQPVDQLRSDAHSAASLSYAALENEADIELLADLGDIDGLPLKGERRIAGDHEQSRNLGQGGNDVFRDSVGEIFLLDVAAHILERQYGDRSFVRRDAPFRSRLLALRRRLCSRSAADLDRVDTDRLRNVLQRSRAEVARCDVEPRLDLAISVLGKADRPRLGHALQSRGDIDAVAHQVAVRLLDYIADMNADPEFNPPVLGEPGIALGHAVLHFDRAAHGVNGAAKLDDGAVAGALHDAAVVNGDGGVDQIASERPQPGENAFFISAGQPRIADNVGHQNRRQFPGFAHPAPPSRKGQVSTKIADAPHACRPSRRPGLHERVVARTPAGRPCGDRRVPHQQDVGLRHRNSHTWGRRIFGAGVKIGSMAMTRYALAPLSLGLVTDELNGGSRLQQRLANILAILNEMMRRRRLFERKGARDFRPDRALRPQRLDLIGPAADAVDLAPHMAEIDAEYALIGVDQRERIELQPWRADEHRGEARETARLAGGG